MMIFCKKLFTSFVVVSCFYKNASVLKEYKGSHAVYYIQFLSKVCLSRILQLVRNKLAIRLQLFCGYFIVSLKLFCN